MPSPERRLVELGLRLPPTVTPAGAYVPAVRSGDLVHTSGQVPLREDTLLAQGKLGESVTTARGYECARQCALNALAALRDEIGDLSAVRRIVKVVVFVASSPTFIEQPQVADGASDLLRGVFGHAGSHARSAIGVAALPLDAPVEVEVIFKVA
ncbi:MULTISPECIES: RidA family protein [Nonomuraea]|uniref:RidA family protein n=1 Tax=Nonomuraea mangrovi TaxID=2316207 RepID=A0ABW4SUJ5_9ACTN